MSSNTRADTMAASAPCAKLLAAFMGLGCVIVQKRLLFRKMMSGGIIALISSVNGNIASGQ